MYVFQSESTLHVCLTVKKLVSVKELISRVTYAFQSESTLYICVNVKELLIQIRRHV